MYLFTWKEFIDVVNRIEVFLVKRVGARVHLQHGEMHVTPHGEDMEEKKLLIIFR
jgi:hypothetical protein